MNRQSNFTWLCIAVCGLVFLPLSPCTGASADLINLASPNRAPGSFFITFKSPAELASIPRAELDSLTMLPGVVPTNNDAVTRLAKAIAAEVGGTVQGIAFSSDQPAFDLEGANDDARVRRLASDPRIARIVANIMLAPTKDGSDKH